MTPRESFWLLRALRGQDFTLSRRDKLAQLRDDDLIRTHEAVELFTWEHPVVAAVILILALAVILL